MNKRKMNKRKMARRTSKRFVSKNEFVINGFYPSLIFIFSRRKSRNLLPVRTRRKTRRRIRRTRIKITRPTKLFVHY